MNIGKFHIMKDFTEKINEFGIKEILEFTGENNGDICFKYNSINWAMVAAIPGVIFFIIGIWRWRQIQGADLLFFLCMVFFFGIIYSIYYSLTNKKGITIRSNDRDILFYKKKILGSVGVNFSVPFDDVSVVRVVRPRGTAGSGKPMNWMVLLVLKSGQSIMLGNSIIGFFTVEKAQQLASLISSRMSVKMITDY